MNKRRSLHSSGEPIEGSKTQSHVTDLATSYSVYIAYVPLKQQFTKAMASSFKIPICREMDGMHCQTNFSKPTYLMKSET